MSLQVWLPLTKDLRNQGLANVTVTNYGATLDNNGKLGKCYYFDGTDDRITVSGLSLPNIWSYSCWIYSATSSRSWEAVIMLNSTGGDSDLQLGFYTYPSGNRIQNTANGQYNSSIAWTYGLWHHFCGTFDGSNLKTYIDGILINTKAITASLLSRTNLTIGARSTNAANTTAGTFFQGRLNDVRIYDHCLSPMEVKELAKGLVLHYPLNRQGWGQENLMRNTYRADGNNSNQVYGWMANGNGNPEIVTKDGNECIHLQASCTGAYTPSIVSASKLLLENGVDYIVSCDLMYDKEIKVQNTTPVHYHNGSTSSTDPFNLTNVNNGKGFVWKSVKPVANTIIPANTWQHYEMRLTAVATPTDSSLPYSTYRAFIYGAVRTTSGTATVNMWLKNWKIEKGTIATPWCPNSSDTLATTMGLNSTTEYDCSGFCNNGTRTGTFTWTSNTAKYAVSTKFNGTDNAIQTPSLPTMITDKNYTIAVWIYKTVIGSKGYQTIYGGPSGFEIEARNGSANETKFVPWNWGKPMASYELNEWNHCVFVHSDADCKIYLNGEYIATGTAKASNPTGNYFVGAWNTATQQNFDGLMSDFRIYATALSASDVKSLYQNCATIDPDGTIRGQIRS